MSDNLTPAKATAAYRAGWTASKRPGRDLETADERYAGSHTRAERSHWLNGWDDYANGDVYTPPVDGVDLGPVAEREDEPAGVPLVPGVGGRSFIVRDLDGRALEVGADVVTFRGERGTLIRVDAAPMPGKTAKVTTSLGTHYATVYNLSVTLADERDEWCAECGRRAPEVTLIRERDTEICTECKAAIEAD